MSVGKVLYGVLFCAAIPAALVAWSWALGPRMGPALPTVRWAWTGGGLAAAGVALMAVAMLHLWRYGGGLPMNAFPPPRLATRGVYGVIPHPIYVGFCAACVGVSLWAGSAAGLWVTSPLVMLGCAAMVWGYERDDLRRRFGSELDGPSVRLPRGGGAAPSAWERASAYVLVFVPWLVVYEAAGHVRPGDAVNAYFAFERGWPVLPWTEVVYASVYPAVLACPLLARTGDVLRRMCVAGMVATGLGALVYLAVPVVAPPRAFVAEGPLGWLLMLERADGLAGHAACPSFHVAWALIAAAVVGSGRGRAAAGAAWVWAGMVAASCITTGMHALVDLPAGVALFAAAWWSGGLWAAAVRGAERVANSWREYRIGPVRVISHAPIAGLAAFVGVGGAGLLVGGSNVWAVGVVAATALVGAGVWGRVVVGRAGLLRPFGYYGSVIGAAAGGVVVWGLGADVWLLLAALAVVAPWVQALGRARCLVQGCCHGRPTEGNALGIRYEDPRSRVCARAGLRGVPLHPTPLYSVAGNAVIGVALARLWSVGAEPTIIGGAYLVLAGLARFVEESYRGEPHTPVPTGLRLYQWAAVASVVIGLAVMAIPAARGVPPPAAGWGAVGLGAVAGLIYAIAMGVDVPESDRPLARLT